MNRRDLTRRPAEFIVDTERFRTAFEKGGFTSAQELLAIISDVSTDPDRRISACHLVGRHRLHAAVQPLVRAITDAEERVAWESGIALSLIRSRKATRPLIRVIRSGPAEAHRQAAICAFFGIQDERARAALVQVVRNRAAPPRTRALAAEALGLIPPNRCSLAALTQALKDPVPAVRFGALCGFGGFAGLRSVRLERVVSELLDDTALGSETETIAERAGLVLRALQKRHVDEPDT